MHLEALCAATTALLLQLKTFLIGSPSLTGITETQYGYQFSQVVPNSTIGMHLRHITDHYQALFTSVLATCTSTTKIPVIYYDQRQRQPDLEQQKERMVQVLDGLIHQIKTIQQQLTHLPSFPVHIMVRVDPQQPPIPLPSTLEREVWFASHHAIHHAALIRAMCIELQIPFPPDFGIAPSTLAMERKEALDN